MVQHMVPMREGAPLDVLPRQPDVRPLFEEGAEGHGFGKGPVHGAGFYHLHATCGGKIIQLFNFFIKFIYYLIIL